VLQMAVVAAQVRTAGWFAERTGAAFARARKAAVVLDATALMDGWSDGSPILLIIAIG